MWCWEGNSIIGNYLGVYTPPRFSLCDIEMSIRMNKLALVTIEHNLFFHSIFVLNLCGMPETRNALTYSKNGTTIEAHCSFKIAIINFKKRIPADDIRTFITQPSVRVEQQRR